VRDAEPARFAADLFRSIAGEPPSTGRRALATVVLTLLAIVSVPVVLGLWLALVVLIGRIGAAIAPPSSTSRPVASWVIVTLTTLAVLSLAFVVSWTSRRRADGGAGPDGDGSDDPAAPSGVRTAGPMEGLGGPAEP
jgi:hypothetical protein